MLFFLDINTRAWVHSEMRGLSPLGDGRAAMKQAINNPKLAKMLAASDPRAAAVMHAPELILDIYATTSTHELGQLVTSFLAGLQDVARDQYEVLTRGDDERQAPCTIT